MIDEQQQLDQQPKPDSKGYSDLIREVERGIIRVPKFQRDFVWSLEKTANLLDSILKGYPIGTFILWRTNEQINDVKKIGDFTIPAVPPGGEKAQYVLDGQQRITSLFAAYRGAKIQKTGEKKITNYKDIVVNLDKNLRESGDQIITAEQTGEKAISLFEVLNFSYQKGRALSEKFTDEELGVIDEYSTAFKTYEFSTIVLRKEDIDSAIEVFTRINTGGQTLTLFEIMSAKTYDEKKKFDMQTKWAKLIKELKDSKYEGVSNTIVLQLLAFMLSRTKECKRKTILALDKKEIIENWDSAISALKESINYFRTIYRIPVSKILPYDSLLVLFAYFFFKKEGQPGAEQGKYLEELFWRMSLSERYSSSTESRLAQDIKRIGLILEGKQPDYSDININLDSPQTLIDTNFSAGSSYCKAILCLLAYQEPKDFQNNGKVYLDNSTLKVASSKNYHHFFPKKHLKDKQFADSLVNITFISAPLNQKKIRAKTPSIYINEFKDESGDTKINEALNSHLISLDSFGIESDDYNIFLEARAKRIYDELNQRIELNHTEPAKEEVKELVIQGESDTIEFKSTLRYDLRTKEVNKRLEHTVAKTIAAFLNSDGGNLLIGVDDAQNALGLTDDIKTLSKDNIDGFELHLIGIIEKYIGGEYSTHIKVTFPIYDNVQICRIRVSESSKPVFVEFEGKESFFVRSGCSSQPLSREKQSVYEKEHWGS